MAPVTTSLPGNQKKGILEVQGPAGSPGVLAFPAVRPLLPAVVPGGDTAPVAAARLAVCRPLLLLRALTLALLLPAGAVVDVAEGRPLNLHVVVSPKKLPERRVRLLVERGIILGALLGTLRLAARMLSLSLLLGLPCLLLSLLGLPLRLLLSLLLRLCLLLLLCLLCLLLGLALLFSLCLRLRLCLLLLCLGLLLRLSLLLLVLLLLRIRRSLKQLAAPLLGCAALLRHRRWREGAGANIRAAAQYARWQRQGQGAAMSRRRRLSRRAPRAGSTMSACPLQACRL